MCVVDLDPWAIAKLSPQGWDSEGNDKAFPAGLSGNVDSVCKNKKYKTKPIIFTSPPPGYRQSEDCSPKEPAPAEVSWTCLLNSAVYRKLCLLVYLYAVTPPSCSVLYSKQTQWALGFWGFSIRERAQSTRSHSSVYLFFIFLQFGAVSRQVQVLGSHVMGMAAKSPLSDLICYYGSSPLLDNWLELCWSCLSFQITSSFPHWFFVLLLLLVP